MNKKKVGKNADAVKDKELDSVLVYGLHPVKSLLENAPNKIKSLFVQKGAGVKINNLLNEFSQVLNAKIEFVAQDYLDDLTGGNHQGLAAICLPQQVLNEMDLEKIVKQSQNPFLLILDGITDPHNLGACIRTAYSAGVDAVIIPRDKSASLNSTVRKVASGAAEVLPLVQVTNLARTMQVLQDLGVWVVGTDADACEDMYQVDMKTPIAIVMGSEGKGMRRLTRETCDFVVRIPMINELDSLNISVAAGVLIYEVLRQRHN